MEKCRLFQEYPFTRTSGSKKDFEEQKGLIFERDQTVILNYCVMVIFTVTWISPIERNVTIIKTFKEYFEITVRPVARGSPLERVTVTASMEFFEMTVRPLARHCVHRELVRL